MIDAPMGNATPSRSLCEIPLSRLAADGRVTREAEGQEILVVGSPDAPRVYGGVCPHLGGPLLRAEVERGRIRCPWHRYEFDVSDGRCLTVPGGPWRRLPGRGCSRPAPLRLRRLPFEVVGDRIRVLAPEGPG